MGKRDAGKIGVGAAALIVAEASLAHFGVPGILLGGAAAWAAYEYSDPLVSKWAEKSSSQPKRAQKPGKRSLAYRMIAGKSVREPLDMEIDTEPQEVETSSSSIPSQFQLDDVLDFMIAVNAQGYVYFGQSTSGPVYINMYDIYHVMDVSSSGKGKSNRFRLAMMQLVSYCETYYINPIASTVKSVKDDRKIEVWQPIYERLANKKPVKEGPEIERLLNALVHEIQVRNQQEESRDFSWQERPIFVFIDELPEVFKRCPVASELLDSIVRMGRNYCVFAYVASQTAAVSDIGQSTASQAQYKTRIYGGGDRNSSGRMMKGAIPIEDEQTLQTNGAGLTLMLAEGFSSREFVRAPLVTNEGLFKYLALPPFQIEDWLTREKTIARPGGLSFSSGKQTTLLAQDERDESFMVENERAMKEPLERDETFMSLNERDESFTPSHEDEVAVLMAVLQLQNEGVAVTREAIKQRLVWNNSKHPVVKFVCDKHKIAVR